MFLPFFKKIDALKVTLKYIQLASKQHSSSSASFLLQKYSCSLPHWKEYTCEQRPKRSATNSFTLNRTLCLLKDNQPSEFGLCCTLGFGLYYVIEPLPQGSQPGKSLNTRHSRQRMILMLECGLTCHC